MIRENLIFEKLLIEKLKSGAVDSFSDIFSIYYKDLVFFANSFIHELSSAEYIVQDAFVKLWEDHEKLNVIVSLKSILLKTIQNKCIDWHRYRKIINNHSTFILGLEGCLWSEFVNSPELLEYMVYPRMFAIAETGWTPASEKDFEGFLSRLEIVKKRYDAIGINYFKGEYRNTRALKY